MGTELLVASLWGAVVVYWLWSRRPTTSDTVGLFRRELVVLQHTAPARVAPANRRCASGALAPGGAPNEPKAGRGLSNAVPAMSAPLAAAALAHRRSAARRRRRDVLLALSALVALTLLIAVVSGSAVAIGIQVLSDVVLAVYVSLVVKMAQVKAGAGSLKRAVSVSQPARRSGDGALGPATSARCGMVDPTAAYYAQLAAMDLTVKDLLTAGGPPGIGPSWSRTAAAPGDETRDQSDAGDQPSYGDFDSYASLAFADAH